MSLAQTRKGKNHQEAQTSLRPDWNKSHPAGQYFEPTWNEASTSPRHHSKTDLRLAFLILTSSIQCLWILSNLVQAATGFHRAGSISIDPWVWYLYIETQQQQQKKCKINQADRLESPKVEDWACRLGGRPCRISLPYHTCTLQIVHIYEIQRNMCIYISAKPNVYVHNVI